MRFGPRKFSLNKRIAARTSWKRVVRHSLGLKAPRGWGWLTDPRKAAYNRVYNRTTTGWGVVFAAFAAMARLAVSAFSSFSSSKPGSGQGLTPDRTNRRSARRDLMSDQTEYAGFEASEFAENPEPRVPCVLLLDVSGSMSGKPIAELNEGLTTLKDTLSADSLASRRAELAIVTFGGTVDVVQDFVTAENFQPPILSARGGTPMAQAIITGLDMIATRKSTYRANGISYYRPWVFLITDGGPDDGWQTAAEQVKAGEASKGFAFFTVGVEGSNFDVLAKISSRAPVKLKGLNFRDLFLWLSQSMQSVSQSSPGDKVALPPAGWAEV